MSKPTLEELQEALNNVDGRTPQEVLDAFIPKGVKVGGMPLHDITFGHGLFLAQVDHPLSKGEIHSWKPYDIAIALFAFTRSSRELHRLVKEDQLEDELYEFLEEIPISEIETHTSILIAHYLGSMKTVVDMKSPNEKQGQKKTLSAGS